MRISVGLSNINIILLSLAVASCDLTSSSRPGYDEMAEIIQVSEISQEMAKVRDYVPLYANIAHRGTTYWAPEETEASWRWAREMGSDYLEGDLQCSKDGIVLAVHDNTFKRTSDVASVFSDKFSEVRTIFYRSFRNPDGSQHFSESDVQAQVSADMQYGNAYNARDYYYAEILMLDAGSWFNKANPDRARSKFESDGKALDKTLEAGQIIYCNGQYISALNDMISFAEGKTLARDSEGRRLLSYKIRPGFESMTLKQIRERTDSQRGTKVDGQHYDASPRYMDFVEYDFNNAYISDDIDSGHRPGIYIEFKESSLQPSDIEARVYNTLNERGWNIMTSPSSDKRFYINGKVNVGNTNGKVVLQTFRIEAVERVESLFKGKVPMCYLVDDEPPKDWDPDHYFDTPEDAVRLIDYVLEHKCHIIGPSVAGEPNNYPNRYNHWQMRLVRRAGMLNHPWSIDSESQMETTMDAMFTNRSNMTLKWLIDKGLRCNGKIPHPFYDGLVYDNSQAPSSVPDPQLILDKL